jgi:hypothetical protein
MFDEDQPKENVELNVMDRKGKSAIDPSKSLKNVLLSDNTVEEPEEMVVE